jgi:hypothetical protein
MEWRTIDIYLSKNKNSIFSLEKANFSIENDRLSERAIFIRFYPCFIVKMA